MSNVGNAVAGVVASAAVLLGGYGLDSLETRQERAAIADCIDAFEGPARNECIVQVREDYDETYIPNILAITGVVGVVGCGYLGYKALRDDIGTTGILEDHL